MLWQQVSTASVASSGASSTTPLGEDDKSRRASIARKRRAESPETESRSSSRRPSTGSTPTSARRKSGGSHPVSEDLKYCGHILRELHKRQNLAFASPFLVPVDPVRMGIPDYLSVIKNPMDLSTMKKKLDSRGYGSAEDFEADFRLMCANCRTYNGPNSSIVDLCGQLETCFQDLWNNRPSRQQMSFGGGSQYGSQYQSELDAIDSRIAALNQQSKSIQEQINKLIEEKATLKLKYSGQQGLAKRQQKGLKKKESVLKPLTFEEKRQLSLDINDLPPDRLGRIVEIIQENMPHLREGADSDEIELDIDALDLKTLNQLLKYVKNCKLAPNGDSDDKKRRRKDQAHVSRSMTASSEESVSDEDDE